MTTRIDSRRVVTIVRRIAYQIRRDRRTLGLMIVAPIVVTVLFAFMFTGSISNVPTAICILDEPLSTSLGETLSTTLENNENVTVFYNNGANAFVGLGSSIQAVLVIPSTLTWSVVRGENVTISLFVNTTTELQANYILSLIAKMTSEASFDMFGRHGIQLDQNITFDFSLPPVGTNLTFNLTVINEDIGFPDTIGAIFQDLLSKNENLSITTFSNREEVLEAIREERAIAGVYMSSNFTKALLRGEQPTMELFVNGIESSEAATALSTLQESLSDAISEALGRNTEVDLTYVYGEAGMSMIDLVGPSMIGFLSVFFGFLIPGIFFLRERQQGTLERMQASPLTNVEIVLGYVIAFIGVSLIQTSLVSCVIIYFSPRLLSSILMMIPLVLLLSTGSVTLAIAVSYRMKNELQVMQMIPLFIIPQMFLSGLLFPLSMLPVYLVLLPYVFPLTYYVMAVKAVVFFNASFLDVLMPLAVLLLYCLLGIVLSIVKRSEK